MKGKLEIYIRHNSSGAQLHIYVPESQKKSFLDAIKSGVCDLSEADANFEMSILQEKVLFMLEPSYRELASTILRMKRTFHESACSLVGEACKSQRTRHLATLFNNRGQTTINAEA
jgi:hypothetical protein